jgi:hypothetical protein
MTCDTCDQPFPDSSVKVWNGKRVCPSCFHTLANLPATSGSDVAARPAKPKLRIDPAAWIDIFTSGTAAPWLADVEPDLLALAEMASVSGKREIAVGEARQWGFCLIIKIKARIATTLAEDLGMPITDAQAITIAHNYLSGVHSASGARMEPDLCIYVPLTEEERRVAEEIGYLAWKAYTAHEKKALTEQQLKSLTGQAIALGENRYRKDWKAAFDGVQQRMRDSAYSASARAVANYLAFARAVPAAYLQFGASLGLRR